MVRASGGVLRGYSTQVLGGGAIGVLASKWGLGVSHSMVGNDLHYEASGHFMRAPWRAVVVAEMFFSFKMRRDAM